MKMTFKNQLKEKITRKTSRREITIHGAFRN